MNEGLPAYVVYDHPSDYPDWYVVRQFWYDQPTPRVFGHKNLGMLRAYLEGMGLTPIARSDEDDPKIIETWI